MLSMENSSVEKVPNLLVLYGSSISDVNFNSHVVGTSFVKNSAALLKFLKDKVAISDVLLKFVREPENQYDSNAVRVDVSVKGSGKYCKLGYVPKDIAPIISYVLKHDEKYVFRLDKVTFYGGDMEKPNIGVFFDYHILDTEPDDTYVGDTSNTFSPSMEDLDRFFGDGSCGELVKCFGCFR